MHATIMWSLKRVCLLNWKSRDYKLTFQGLRPLHCATFEILKTPIDNPLGGGDLR